VSDDLITYIFSHFEGDSGDFERIINESEGSIKETTKVKNILKKIVTEYITRNAIRNIVDNS
jgi:hypothetical protein